MCITTVLVLLMLTVFLTQGQQSVKGVLERRIPWLLGVRGDADGTVVDVLPKMHCNRQGVVHEYQKVQRAQFNVLGDAPLEMLKDGNSALLSIPNAEMPDWGEVLVLQPFY